MVFKDKKFQTLLKLFKKVEESGLSAKAYFASHTTPIGVVQYFRLKKRFDQQGEIGLLDQRHSGNARKLTEEQIQLMQGIFTYNRQLSSGALQNELLHKWGIQLHRSRIHQLRNQLNLPRLLPETTRQETVQLAGIEIFAALAHHVGILAHWNTTIQQRLEQVKQTEQYGDGLGTGDHIDARRRDGTFLSRYNRLADVRQMKFASINDKIKTKDFSRLTVYQRTEPNLSRKNLAALLLPLVTNNGAVRSLDKPLGNALRYACGYNYKNATIDKYLRELKYLQVAEDLIDCDARFWSHFWKVDDTPHKVACYYIDGNVKPLWSSKRCRKGKVSMLGRVMGCLEQVLIHDGRGRPIYFRTFPGYADLQKHALQAMEQLDELLNEAEEPGAKKSHCSRALIIDGAGNAVKTLRAFSQSPYHYITILDTNQMHDRKFKHLTTPQRYHYGEAMLQDCRIELIDSTESGYLYESRAVRIQWDNGRESCLVTSIPETLFNASEVVKAYFDRWPYGEKQFAMMKASVCFFQIVGYGKKCIDDTKMLDRINQLETDLRDLQNELETPLSQITVKEQELQALFEEERQLKEKSKIQDGERILSIKNQQALEICQRRIRKNQSEIKAIEKPFKRQFNQLRWKSKEFARIQGKRTVYHVDVELDQLMTSFRLTLANLLTLAAKIILNETPIEMNALIQSILFLPGSIELVPGRRIIHLTKNEKDTAFMEKLAQGLTKLNELNIRHPSGATYEFKLD
jgi:transposase